MYFNEISSHFMRRLCVAARLNSPNKGIFIGAKTFRTKVAEKMKHMFSGSARDKHNELNAP